MSDELFHHVRYHIVSDISQTVVYDIIFMVKPEGKLNLPDLAGLTRVYTNLQYSDWCQFSLWL